MSLPFYKDWFSFQIRRNRISFVVAVHLLLCISISIATLFSPGESVIYSGNYLYRFPFDIVIFIIAAQRLRDFNWSGKWVFCLIPVVLFDFIFNAGVSSFLVLILLCAIPGTKGENKYGKDPTEYKDVPKETELVSLGVEERGSDSVQEIIEGVPFEKSWLSYKIRRNRKSYIFASMANGFLIMVLAGVAALIGKEILGVVMVLLVPFYIAALSLVSQRFKDINLSGWLTALLIVALVIDKNSHTLFASGLAFILLVEPGTKGINKYGDDPLVKQVFLVPKE